MIGMHVVSTGRALPQKVVTNEDLSKIVETNDEWIQSRTGIRQRYIAVEETATSLSVDAAKQAIERAGINKKDIGYVVVATITPDYNTPSVACMVQRELGLSEDIMAFDINAACSGFLYGLKMVHSLLSQDRKKYALLMGCELLSRITDFGDRSTCVLFGDGCGAVLLEASEHHAYVSTLGARGDNQALVSEMGERVNGDMAPSIKMDGKEVFRFAVDVIPKCIAYILAEQELTMENIDYVVCHQANARIINHVRKKMKAPEEKFYMNIADYSNTSSASIPIALDEMAEKGLLKPGMKIICVGFGGGFTWGGALLEW